MRSNAIIRIIIWSVVILVLLGILLAGLGAGLLVGNVRTSEVVEETMVPITLVESDGEASFPADEIHDLEIEWVSGSILIQPADVEEIQVSESDVSDSKYAMLVKQNRETLSIAFCEDNDFSFSFGINVNTNISKDLTILVPRDWTCNSLELDTASASVEVNDLTIREVEFDGASGNCEFENCTVNSIEMDTASGDVKFYGSLDMLDFDGASGAITAVLTNTPSRLDMDGMSGDMDITLPADAGFTVTLDGMSTEFSSDFETTVKNGNQVHGDGRCRINVDAMSGDVFIRKGSAVPEAPTTAETPTTP